MSNVIALRKRRPEKENARTVGTESGASGAFHLQQQRQCSERLNPLQAVIERTDVFGRLQDRFARLGWNLHYLDGESCLAVHRQWGASQVCPNHRAAAALLRRIGGAA